MVNSHPNQREPKISLVLDIIQAFLITGTVGIVGLDLWSIQHPELGLIGFLGTGIFAFLFLVNRTIGGNLRRLSRQRDSQIKATLYGKFNDGDYSDESINLLRSRAIQYCQDLIDDYRQLRSQSQIIYYVFQISTVILSGVTPILVLLDKTDTGIPWLKWLPVIFPAIASIVTSISTSFPFQENAVAANTAVEFLEAELEKFILGVTAAYRFNDLPTELERRIKLQEAVESFIVQVNKIHLKQLQSGTEAESQKRSSDDSQSTSS